MANLTADRSHQLEIKHRRIKITEEPETRQLLAANFFCQSYNYRRVVGIYVKPYDFSGVSPAYPKRGFSYHCVVVNTDIGEGSVSYRTINDWDLRQLDDQKLKDELVQIIAFDRQYETQIAESSFMKYFTGTVSKMVPVERLHITFREVKDADTTISA